MDRLKFLLPLMLAVMILSSCGLSLSDLTAEKGFSVNNPSESLSSTQPATTNSAKQSQYNYFWDKSSDNGIIPFSGYLKNASLKMQHEIVPRDLSIDEDTFSKLFSLISRATRVPCPDSFFDGYRLMLEYESINNLPITIQIYGFHDGETISAYIKSTNGESYPNNPDYFQSAELVSFIQSIIGWKEFDIKNLSGVNEISVQTVFGIQKSDTATIISGKDAETIKNSIIENSKWGAPGKCGYNIKVLFKTEDGTEYHGLLAGDSCPDIAIEGCVFRIDPMIVKTIYEKINYDCPIGPKKDNG